MDIDACLARINELADRADAGTANAVTFAELIDCVQIAQRWAADGGWTPQPSYDETMARPVVRLAAS
jgi:hypothetical protein